MRPVYIRDYLSPIMGEPRVCPQCGNKRARFVEEDKGPICSLCYLYEARSEHDVPTGLTGEFAEYVREFEKGQKRQQLGDDGKLVEVGDADHHLAVLILTTRKFEEERKMDAVLRHVRRRSDG